LVLGAAVAIVDGSVLDAARAAANSAVSVPGSASLRLLGLDPYQVHALHHQLAGEIEAVARSAATAAVVAGSVAERAAQLPAESSPAMDVLAEFHLHQEVRLFAS
jgi:urease accessory protein